MPLPEKLEQAVYYAASESLEGISGMGIIAASLTDGNSLRSMNDAFRPALFLPDKTAYSFLYHADFGFCVAATTTRQPSGSNRKAPFVHIVFSGAHPDDPADTYGFRADYQTGDAALPQVLAPLERVAIPWRDILSLSGTDTAQLAGLIRRLWLLNPLFRGRRTMALAAETLSDLPTDFPRLMCALMDLLPGSMREWLWGTTAPTSALSDNTQFPIRFAPNGTAFDRLPRLTPKLGDYFGGLCVRMAKSYRDDRETFHKLTKRIDHVLRSDIQFTQERLAIAVCCAFLEDPACPWVPSKAEIAALLENLERMLPNLSRDLEFWQEQANLLREASQGRTLLSILKQVQRQNLPVEKQCLKVVEYYQNASGEERDEFADECRRALTSESDASDALRYAVWLCPEKDSRDLMARLFPVRDRQDFYLWLKEQLDFWRPLLYGNRLVNVKTPTEYYSEEIRGAPVPTFQEIAVLAELSQEEKMPLLFDRYVAEEKIGDGLKALEELPPVSEWESSLAAWLRSVPRCSAILRERWDAMRTRICSAEELQEWKTLGFFLGVSDPQKSADEFLFAQIENSGDAESVREVLEKYASCLDRTCEQRVRKKIEELGDSADFSQTETLEALYSVWELLNAKRYVSSPAPFQDKLTLSQMYQRFFGEPFPNLLRERTQFWKFKTDEYQSQAETLWARSIENAIARDEPLEKKDFMEVQNAFDYLNKRKLDGAENLCEYFFRKCYECLDDFRGAPTPMDSSFQEIGKRRLSELAVRSGLEKIIFYNRQILEKGRRLSDAWFFDCPPEPWIRTDGEDKVKILSRLAKEPRQWKAAYKKSLCEDVPLSRLFQRLCNEGDWKKKALDDALFEELLEYVALLMPYLPEEKQALELLLKTWSAAPAETSLYGRKRKLFDRLGELDPPPNAAHQDAMETVWQSVFRQPLNLKCNMMMTGEDSKETKETERAEKTKETQRAEEAKESAPEKLRVSIKIGKALTKQRGQETEAETLFRQALKIDPDNLEALTELGKLLARQRGRQDEAETIFRRTLKVDPNNVYARIELGRLLAKQPGRQDEAEELFRDAFAIDRKSAPACMELGRLLAKQPGRQDEAETIFRRALEIDRKSVPARMELGCLLAQTGWNDAAARLFWEVSQIDPKNVYARTELGRLLARQPGREVEAEETFKQALQTAPDNVFALTELGRLLARQPGREAEAEDLFRQALKFDPGNARAWTELQRMLPESAPEEIALQSAPEESAPLVSWEFLLALAYELCLLVVSVLAFFRVTEWYFVISGMIDDSSALRKFVAAIIALIAVLYFLILPPSCYLYNLIRRSGERDHAPDEKEGE